MIYDGGVFDQNLNARQLTSFIGSTYGDDFNYSYDANGRVTNINAVANNSFDRNLTYDGAGRLKTASGPWGSGTYVYDPLGNITKKTLGSRVVDIEYTSLNRVNRVRDTGVSSSWRNYSHDARGNVTADGKHGFGYDYANQPTSISGTDSGSYAYDGHLRRVKQIVNGETIYSIYDASGALLTRDNATTSEETDYLAVAGQTFARLKNGVATYPINDHLGTASMVANSSGSILSGHTFNYTPFGESWGANDPGNDNQQGYTGHIEDETGLTYMQARYYDPIMGRFMSTDPIGYEDQLNLYAYVGNDPINAFDPNGKNAVFVVDPLAAAGNGHTTLYFQDSKGSWYSYNQYAAGGTSVGASNAAYLAGFNAPGEVVISRVSEESIPTGGLVIETGMAQDAAIHSSALRSWFGHLAGKLEYNLYSNNCTDAAVDVVNNAGVGITVSNPAFTVRPNSWIANASATNSNYPASSNTSDSSTESKPSDQGMSSGKVSICSGMGAEKGGCNN